MAGSEELDAADERHLKIARAMQARALEVIRVASARELTAAARVLRESVRIEREVLIRLAEREAAAVVERVIRDGRGCGRTLRSDAGHRDL